MTGAVWAFDGVKNPPTPMPQQGTGVSMVGVKNPPAQMPELDLGVSNTSSWVAFAEDWRHRASGGADPSEILEKLKEVRAHFEAMGAKASLSNPTHFADLQTLGWLRLDLIYWRSQRALEGKWPMETCRNILSDMEALGSPLEDRLDLLRHLGKDRDYLDALRKVLEKWERFPGEMKRRRPFPPVLKVKDSWGREECYDALGILDLSFKSNWKPGLPEWEGVATSLVERFLAMGLARYAKEVLDLSPEANQSPGLEALRKKVVASLDHQEPLKTDGTGLY